MISRARSGFRSSSALLFMEYTPLITWRQLHFSYNQRTGSGLAGHRKMPTNQFDSLMHFAQSNMFAKAGLVKDCLWFEATGAVLHLQMDHWPLTLERQAGRSGARVFTHIGERL